MSSGARLLLAAALVLGLAGCREAPRGSLEAGLLDLADEAAAAGLAPRPPARALTRQRLEDLARAVDLRGSAHPVDALNSLIFKKKPEFERWVDDPGLQQVLLPWVLSGRRGTCLGLGGLYLALARRLDLPLRAVLLPGHLFLRHEGPKGARDVELLKQGRAMPRAWYRQRYRFPEPHPLYFTHPLDDRQTLAVFRFNLANALRRQGRSHGALPQYRRVVHDLPHFAEAHANLGLVLQALGRTHEARQADRTARMENPLLE